MRIYLKNIPNTYNYGSMMMAENMITYINKLFPNDIIEYYTDANTEQDLIRLQQATGYQNIHKNPVIIPKLITRNIKYVRHIERLIRKRISIRKLGKFYDAVIVLGGDDFAETYYTLPRDNGALKEELFDLKRLNDSTQLFMVGQTIGPYSGERIDWAKTTLKDIHIYSRDDVSAEYIKQKLSIDVNQSRDLAFLDLYKQREINNKGLLASYGLEENKYITVVGTGLINLYTKSEDNFIDSFYDMIKAVKEKYNDMKIVYLAHVITPGVKHTDLYPAEQINKKYDHYLDKNLVVINATILPAEARTILGGGLMTITCRMHAAVSTYQMNKPAICLSYSQKYRGVISEGLGRGDLVIEAKNDDFWENGITEAVLEKTEYVFNNHKQLVKEISNSVEKCKEMAMGSIIHIVQIIKNINV